MRSPTAHREAALDDALSAANAGRAHLFVVDGPSGMGKTVTLGRLVEKARAHDTWRVHRTIAAHDEQSIPFAYIERLLSSLGQADAIFDAEDLPQPVAVARHCLRALQAKVDTGARLLVIDDAQWLDAESERVLRYALPRMMRPGVLVAIGIRTPHADSSLGSFLLATASGGTGRVLHVEPLTPDEVQALALDRFAVRIARRNAADLCRAAGGSFLGIDGLFSRLTPDEVSRLHLVWDLPIRRTLDARNPLTSEYRAADSAARLIGELVCLAGAEVPAERLRQAAMRAATDPGIDTEDGKPDTEPADWVTAALERALAAGIIVEAGFGATLAPRHALVADAVRQAVPRERAAAVHRALAQVSDGHAAVVHRLRGASAWDEELGRDVEYCTTAALERGRPESAIEVLRLALDLADDPVRRGVLITRLALIHTKAKSCYACLDLLGELEALPQSILREFLVLMLRAYLVDQEFPQQRALAVLQAPTEDPDERTIQSFMAFLLAMMTLRSPDGPNILLPMVPLVRGIFERAPSDPAQVADPLLHWMVTPREFSAVVDCYTIVAVYRANDVPGIMAALPRLLELTAALPDTPLKTDCLVPLASAQLFSDQVVQARDLMEQALTLMDTVGLPWGAGAPYLLYVDAQILLGEYGAALDRLETFMNVFEVLLDIETRLTAAALRALHASITGSGEAAGFLRGTERLVEMDWQSFGHDTPIIAACEAARVAGDPEAALAATADPALLTSHNSRRGYLGYRAHALLDLGRVAEAAELIGRLSGLRGSGWFEYWGTLDWLQARLAQARGLESDAAAAYARALEVRTYPLPRALTLADQAEFLAGLGDYKRAEDAVLESLSELDRIGAYGYIDRVGELRRRITAQSGDVAQLQLSLLTERERQVAKLIAAGMGNPAIARELFVSQATVRFHVSNILRKLQVESRAQVSAALAKA
ncbi:helix-turn-helix transcriptional regulator [Brevibacterium moorei]|uniref:helix-turn-helix transcriptional regulator n=1 Tax=Brevibacterium moorei TaxID=2968457 RepID=UPI00211BC717|nr:LuxR family transcriptional regulator [Brevibacterium sp. 68QC2CO]MCQ9386112.1 LuxR family transcriptional regulator [Brevibacterium sp. 68QC2CO]